MDLEKYLLPLSEELPCGDDLEDMDDMAFYELENMVPVSHEMGMFDNDEEVNWSDVADKSQALLDRSKDIRTVLCLTQAELNLNGIKGFSEAINLLAKLMTDYWETVYPLLDPDDGDPLERVNALKILGDSGSILNILKKLPIAESRGFGNVSLRDCEIANGSITPASEDESVEVSHVTAVFMEAKKESLVDKSLQISQLIEVLKSFDAYLLEIIPADAPTEIKTLIKVLSDMLKCINSNAQNRDDWAADSNNSESDADESQDNNENSSTHAAAVKVKKGINNRSDVTKGIDDICKYYEKNEPSSPVPLLLQRAKRMVDMDFMEIIKDMAGEAISEVRNITGVKEENEDNY